MGWGGYEELLWAFIQSSFQHLLGICSTLETKLEFANKNTSNRGKLVSSCDKALKLGFLDLNSRFGLLGASLEHLFNPFHLFSYLQNGDVT